MRPNALRAGTALLLGALFLGGLAAEAYGLHECPDHHPHGDAHASGPAPDGAPHGQEHGALHGERHDAPHGHGHDAQDRAGEETASHEGPCACPGGCHAASAPGPGTAPGMWTGGPTDADPRPVPAPELLPGPEPYLLPFANAPPRF